MSSQRDGFSSTTTGGRVVLQKGMRCFRRVIVGRGVDTCQKGCFDTVRVTVGELVGDLRIVVGRGEACAGGKRQP